MKQLRLGWIRISQIRGKRTKEDREKDLLTNTSDFSSLNWTIIYPFIKRIKITWYFSGYRLIKIMSVKIVVNLRIFFKERRN